MRYRVKLVQTFTRTASVIVSAKDEDEAADKAEALDTTTIEWQPLHDNDATAEDVSPIRSEA